MGEPSTMRGKVVVITGGNAGIGKETAVGLAALGATVIFTSRNPDRGADALREIRERGANEDVHCLPLDLASTASIKAFAAELLGRFDRLDVLINNAGLILSARSETAEGLEMTFAVNHLGHFMLTALLLDRLKASAPARIINVSSDAHRAAVKGLDFDDLQANRSYGSFRAYAQSKLANVLFTRELARRLEGSGVAVNALHPGLVRSRFAGDGDVRGLMGAVFGMISWAFGLSPAEGAETSIWLASAPELSGRSGGYFVQRRERAVSRAAADPAAARRLWEVSVQLTGVGG
ncbi:MAG: SDR family oxidoreductase [Nannocystis sp.]|nr:SDR family oxidoreductase [Nannocystis sp.]